MTDKEFRRRLQVVLWEVFFGEDEKREVRFMTEKELVEMSDQWSEELARIHSSDPVNHPAHYGGKYETIDVIRDVLQPEKDAEIGYYIGNVVKYISRYRKKGQPLQDLKKAAKYLDWAVKRLEELEG